ncbi:MAG: CDP-glycerol glycerophosphotransferase family protein [Clostridia bacterium]|nr:CDP-glycerol glycerophosphotransferase family protein [Clostridia bacterium]
MSILNKIASAAAWGLSGLLPIKKNKIVFCSFYGKGYSDHCKAITEVLLKSEKKLDIVWLVRPGEEASLPAGVRAVNYNSTRRIRELCTAKCWVDNCRKGALRKRKKQYYMQVWHGLALKRIEKDAATKLDDDYTPYAVRDSEQIDVIISNCTHMTKVYQSSFWYDGQVAEFGSPRNDILFTPAAPIREKVHAAFSLPQDRKLVLYGPTFRADHSIDAYKLDTKLLRQALSERFGGEWTVLVRMHPAVEALSEQVFAYDGETVCNATPYPDIMELLAASDCTITDYSSLMFDFALTERPCFQFATDLQAYMADRNFYFPLTELPFPRAESNEALAENIRSFREEDRKLSWERFNRDFGLKEDGKAAERCAALLLKQLCD